MLFVYQTDLGFNRRGFRDAREATLGIKLYEFFEDDDHIQILGSVADGRGSLMMYIPEREGRGSNEEWLRKRNLAPSVALGILAEIKEVV